MADDLTPVDAEHSERRRRQRFVARRWGNVCFWVVIDGQRQPLNDLSLEGFSLPMGVSYLPMLGDLLDLAETAHNLSNAHELIIQFDEQGVVRKRSLRALP